MKTTRKTPQWNNFSFKGIFKSYETFSQDYSKTPFKEAISDESLEILFYLLYGRYGNSTIMNRDINQFKYKLFGIIYTNGPSWEKRLDIQKKVRELTDEEMREGGKTIANNAMNPQTTPTTDTTEELEYIDQQNVNKIRKGKIEALTQQWSMIATDVTEEFILKFSVLFKKIVSPENPLLYITEEETEEETEEYEDE